MTHDFLDPFMQSEIGYRRARLSVDWHADSAAERRWWKKPWREHRGAGAETPTASTTGRRVAFQPLFETVKIDWTRP